MPDLSGRTIRLQVEEQSGLGGSSGFGSKRLAAKVGSAAPLSIAKRRKNNRGKMAKEMEIMTEGLVGVEEKGMVVLEVVESGGYGKSEKRTLSAELAEETLVGLGE